MRSTMLLQRLNFESKRQNDVSRSLHSLAAAERIETPQLSRNPVPRNSNRRQTSAVDASFLQVQNNTLEGKFLSVFEENSDDRPVVRRKRFTRRQRKSASICPETGLLLAFGGQISSSDEDELPKKLSPSCVKPRGLSASTFELSFPEQQEDTKRQPHRGPAARRAGRRNAKLQQIHASANNLNNLDRIDELPLKSDQRSLSVRDLQGEECDFRNQDSVTKWTSQILAELESLPSSCIDLPSKTEKLQQPKWTKAAPTTTTTRMTQSTYFTNWRDKPEEWRMTASVKEWGEGTWMTPVENHVSDVMSQSLSSVSTITRERENSLAAEIGSETDSEAGTPLAVSPAPLDEVPLPLQKVEKHSPPLNHRSIGIQGPETPLYTSKRASDEISFAIPLSPEPKKRTMQVVIKEGEKIEVVHPPTPAKRTIVRKIESRDAVKLRKDDYLDNASNRLLANISRLSKSTIHLPGTNDNLDRFSQLSIPSIRTSLWSCSDESPYDQLTEWKRRAECRARSNAPVEAKSVDRVVASMIKSIEESRFTAIDRPDNLHLEPKPTDTGTQTSPFSLSRSSSFDWVHDATEGQLRELKTPMSTPRSELPVLAARIESSSETDDADREVAEMTRRAEEPAIRRIPSLNNETQKMFPELEESIAMLLQCGNETEKIKPVAPPRTVAPKAKLRTVPLQVSNTPPEIRRPVPQYALSMSDSIYDNMSISQKKKSEVLSPSKPTASQAIIEELLEGKVPVGNVRLQRAGSCELLNNTPSIGVPALSLKEAEEKAAECCQWLRKAGFPQYANQFEEGKFPLDLRSVRTDHEFLEADSLSALFKRIGALNRYVIMRDDNVVLRRRNEDYNYDMYSFDDEDQVALSGNWKYQRNSHTWSRIGNENFTGAPGRVVSTRQPAVTSYGYRDPYAVKDTRHSPYEERVGRDRGLERYDLRPEEAANSKLQRSQSERIKDTAKALLKKVNPRSGSRRRRESRTRDPSTIEISDPRLLSYNTASPESARMLLSARPTNLPQETRPRQSRSKSARRQGVVLLSPSSPESSSTDDSSFRMRIRERSVPPSRLIERELPFGYDRLRREKTAIDDFLYGHSHNSLNRSRPRVAPLRPPFYENCYTIYGPSALASGGGVSPAFSSSYTSNRLPFQTPTTRSRQLNIHPDGYYMHGHQFDDSPEQSINRRLHHYQPTPSTSSGAVPQLHVDTIRAKSQSSLDNTDEEQCSTAASQNRRDSGVGSDLSRSPSGPSAHRQRQSVLPNSCSLISSVTSSSNSSSNGSWNKNQRRNHLADRLMSSSLNSCGSSDAPPEMFFLDEELSRCIDALPAADAALMKSFSYLTITTALDKHLPNNMHKYDPMAANKESAEKNWMNSFNILRKIKHKEGKTSKELEETTVFGQPLEIIYRRTGHCLPRTILEVLRYLRNMAPDTVGIFRKNGVKSRIAELRQHCDRDSDADVFVDTARLDAGQVHDVADMLKQYLRELPDRLMTARYSEVFASIFLHVPEEERTPQLRYALLLLPDEHREALQTLLFFLADIAKFSEGNSMTATNLAVCFTPSLFHLAASRLDKDKMSNSRRHKTVGASGMPTEKEMQETRAAQMCLTHMIQHVRAIFQTPEGRPKQQSVEYEDDFPLLKELGPGGPRTYLQEKLADLLKDNAERWKSWIVEGHHDQVEISAKKSETHPLRPFRVWVDVPAPPKEVMLRIMTSRQLWDTSVVNWRAIDLQLYPDIDLHQYVLNDTVGHPTRDCYVVRYHKTDIPELKGACAVIERSIQCGETQLLGGISAAVLDSRFLIEPKAGYSRVTYISRVDLRGRSPAWYNRVYGPQLARQMARLRDSFKKDDNFGPETKV